MSPISAPAGPAALEFVYFLVLLAIDFLQQRLGLHCLEIETERLGALTPQMSSTISARRPFTTIFNSRYLLSRFNVHKSGETTALQRQPRIPPEGPVVWTASGEE
jgi:hypothetical protein